MIAIALAFSLVQPAFPQGADETIPPIQDVGDAFVLNFAQGESATDGLSLARFVVACEQVTGINFTYATETQQLLESQTVRLLGTKRVPKEEFYSFFQIMMIINDFVCSEIGEAPLSVVVIDSLKTQARNTIRGDAIYVPPEELEEYAAQPATLITTVINLPNTDVRQLSNSMRTMITDANTQQMLPAGNTNAMVLTGFGSNVAALARMLKIVDEASKIEEVLPEFEVVPLEYTSADEVAPLIEELLEASRRALQGGGRGAVQPQQGATGQIQRGQTEAKIMVDQRSNSLLVMAMPDDIPTIKELIARLDVDIVERERSYHIYSLANVSAEELADTLNEFLQDTARLEAGRGGAGQPGGGQTQSRAGGNRTNEFVVVPDVETNSLLIAASRTRYQELLSLIQRLDQRQDQVLIETALIELTGQDFLDIGVELGLAELPGSSGLGGPLRGDELRPLDVRRPRQRRRPRHCASRTSRSTASRPASSTAMTSACRSSCSCSRSAADSERAERAVGAGQQQRQRDGHLDQRTAHHDGHPRGRRRWNRHAGELQRVRRGGHHDADLALDQRVSHYLRLGIYLEVSTFLGAVSGLDPAAANDAYASRPTVNVPDGDTMVIGGIIIDNRTDTKTQIPVAWRHPDHRPPVRPRRASRSTARRSTSS